MFWRKFPKPIGTIPWHYWLGDWGLITPWGHFQPLKQLLHKYRLWRNDRRALTRLPVK